MSSKSSSEIEKNQEILNKESLKKEDLSSHINSAESFGKEISNFAKESVFEIPSRYYENRLVILPVNSRVEFIYWELNSDYVKSIYDGEISNYTIVVYEQNSGESKEIVHFSVVGDIGRYYLKHYIPNRDIFASIGVVDKDGNFIEILKSNIINTPSDSVDNSQDEMWMSKVKDWMELIEASLEKISDKEGSAALIREKELLKRYQKLRFEIDSKEFKDIGSSEGLAVGGSIFGGSSDFLGGSEHFGSSNISSHEFNKNKKGK